MRDILFKAKRLDNGKWVRGGTIVQFMDNGEHSVYIPAFGKSCDTAYEEKTENILGFSNCVFYKVDPETVCQYSGLSDQAGNMIHENDIMKFKGYTGDFVGVVRVKSGNFELHCDSASPFLDDAILKHGAVKIGNVFDNPGLLKEV